MSLTYGEQGQYSRAEESAGVSGESAGRNSVRFVDVTARCRTHGKPTGRRRAGGVSRVGRVLFLILTAMEN